MSVRLLTGDCRDVLRTLPDESVNCVVTSPPYWGLRDYGVAGQLGLERSLGEHVEVMVDVFREVRRVLRSDGTLWLNYGDSYATSPNGRKAKDIIGDDRTFRDKPFSTIGPIYDPSYELTSREGVTENMGNVGAAHGGRIMAGGYLKPKDICGIPWRVAFALQADGWWLRQDIIWAKPNPMPESIRDRCTKSHEYLFLLAKSEIYHFDADAIAEPVTLSTVERMSQPTLDQQHGSDRVPGKTNGPMKAVLKRSGNVARKPASARGVPGTPEGTTNGAVAGSVPWEGTTRNKRDVWTVPTAPFKDAHFATFPPALIEPCILAGCPEGGTVLDPFGGAGTTGLVADRLGRNAILIELNPAYVALADKRIHADGPLLAQVTA